MVIAEEAEHVQHQLAGLVAVLAGALADGVQEGGQGRVGLAVGGLGGGGGEAGGGVGGLGGQAGAGQQDGDLGVGLDRAEELQRLGRAAVAQGKVGQAGPGGQVVGVLGQDLAPAGGGLVGVEVGGGRGGPVGVAGQQRLDEPLDHLGGLGADELVDQPAPSNALTAGMPWTWKAMARRWFWSTSTRASTTSPPWRSTARSSTGARASQRPHQSAQKSTSTGTVWERSSTSAWKVASVTS